MFWYFQIIEVLTMREIKSRYKGSILGPLWLILYPLITSLFLSFIFEKIVKIKVGNNIPFFIFLYSGIIYWSLFEQGINLAKDSLVWNRELVTKTAFPKETLPFSFIFSKIPDFFVNYIIFLIFLFIYKINFSFSLLLPIISLIPLLLISAAIGLFFSFTNAIFRDFGRMIEFLLMITFYATPIIYQENFVPKKYQLFLRLNPLANIITFNRGIIFEKTIYFNLFILALIISFSAFILSLLFFRHFEKKVSI
jgi:ABC-type polysaccharide/polyol phosphate export systems, permease component